MKDEKPRSEKASATTSKKAGAADSAAEKRKSTSAKSAPTRGGISLPRSVVTSGRKTAVQKSPAVRDIFPEEAGMDEVLEDPGPESEAVPSPVPEEMSEMPRDNPDNTQTARKANTIFRRIKERRERQEEERLSAMELVCKRSGMTEDDVEMLFELGYEYELGKIVGYDNIRRLKCDRLRRFGKMTDDTGSVSFGYRGEEYLGSDSKQRILTAFARDRKALILRAVLTSLISLLLFFLGMPAGHGMTALLPLAEHPWLLFAFSVGLLAAAAALSWRQLFAGLSDLLRFQPTPYTVPAVLLLLVFPYEILTAVFGVPAVSFCFPSAAALLLLAFCDILRYTSELRSFRIFSAEGRKFVLDETEPRKRKLRQGNRLVRILNDDIGERFYRVRTAGQSTGFFRRCNRIFAASAQWNILLLTSFGLSLTAGFIAAFSSGSFFTAAEALISVFLLSLPIHGIFCFFYPMCYSNLLLSRYNCTLAGRGAEEEYAEEKNVIFDDSDLFCVTKYTETALAGNDDLKNDAKLAKILFRKLGGTIAQVGEPAPKAPDPPVKVLRIEDSGIEAVADNRYHLLAGSEAFLKKSGIPVPTESADVALERNVGSAPLYVAIGGILKLKYEIQYGFTPNSEQLIRSLSDDMTSVGIHSYNPNLNDAFLSALCRDTGMQIRICKPGRYETDSVVELSDTGAVALGARADLVYPICAAREICRIDRLGWYLRLASLSVGTIAATVFLLLGHADWINGYTIAAYQAFWLLPAAIASHLRINRRTLHIRKQ